jgi:hypothetical protein
MSQKNPVTRPGIDPGTVRLVAQRLNHYATPGPVTSVYPPLNADGRLQCYIVYQSYVQHSMYCVLCKRMFQITELTLSLYMLLQINTKIQPFHGIVRLLVAVQPYLISMLVVTVRQNVGYWFYVREISCMGLQGFRNAVFSMVDI